MYFYSKTNEIHQILKFILFYSSPLHVSDGLSVHHQESKTVHTASGICHTDSADSLLAGTSTPNGHLYRLIYTRSRIDTINSPDDGHMAARNM